MRCLVIPLMLVLAAAPVYGVAVFQDDFEGSLAQWTGKSEGSHNGVIVVDPLNPLNHVLAFSANNAGGDVFSVELPVTPTATYYLSFDYRGVTPPSGHTAGGFVGFADETSPLPPNAMKFLAGTCFEGNIVLELIDDDTWHHYVIAFKPADHVTISDGAIRITLEDWIGESTANCFTTGPGDAYFDNVRLETEAPVPAQATTWGKAKSLYR